MLIRVTLIAATLLGAPVWAEEPLSAIDWLSESVREKPQYIPETGDIATDAGTDEISVTALSDVKKDTVGLLPPSTTGLPRNFWGTSPTATLQNLIAQQKIDALPEVIDVLYTILLAEVDAPLDAGKNANLLLARLDKLLELGALEQAQALLEHAGPTEAEIFRRWFDVSLLTGHEDHACAAMRAAPDFAPTLQSRIFCLARGGDWDAAALTLATGESLGHISTEDADLLARFLDPDLYEGEPDLPPPARLTPLVFTMREAIAQPRPTGALPLAFLFADLNVSTAWRDRIEAAERLVRTQALPPGILMELYKESKAAASGGIWNRVKAIQAFDLALLRGEAAAITETLPAAFEAMNSVHLEVPFARFYGDRLAGLKLADPAEATRFRVIVLSDRYELQARKFETDEPVDRFLQAVARGNLSGVEAPSEVASAIADAFHKPLPDGEIRDLLIQNRLGEAILRAMLLLKEEAFADPGDIQVAIATLLAVGFENEARRAAIQLMVLERRG